MGTFKSIVSSSHKGDFLALIDLSEAYLHILIQESHQRFLCFSYDSLQFQYQALPFGLKRKLTVLVSLDSTSENPGSVHILIFG